MLSKIDEQIGISVYRKPTSTDRYIPANSHTFYQHKLAGFNSMVHRLCNLPLNLRNYMTELETIKHIARVNGYKNSIINQLVSKHSKKKRLKDLTSLIPGKSVEDKQRRKISYIGPYSFQISRIFKEHNLTCIFGNEGKIKDILGNPKDKPSDLKKPGIYSIKCPHCKDQYIGQTRRTIYTRYQDHYRHSAKGETEKSSVAKHMLENNHSFSIEDLKLIKHVRSPMHLDAQESLEIHRHKPSMNTDPGPITSKLFTLCKRNDRHYHE
jgi:hypothetical protein